jgi:hypothetical protein
MSNGDGIIDGGGTTGQPQGDWVNDLIFGELDKAGGGVLPGATGDDTGGYAHMPSVPGMSEIEFDWKMMPGDGEAPDLDGSIEVEMPVPPEDICGPDPKPIDFSAPDQPEQPEQPEQKIDDGPDEPDDPPVGPTGGGPGGPGDFWAPLGEIDDPFDNGYTSAKGAFDNGGTDFSDANDDVIEDGSAPNPIPVETYTDVGIIWSEDDLWTSDPSSILAEQGINSKGNGDIVAFMSGLDEDFVNLNGTFVKETIPFLGNAGTISKQPSSGETTKTFSMSFSIPSAVKSAYAISYNYLDLEETNQRLGTNFSKKKRIIGGSLTPIISSGKVIRKTTIRQSSGEIKRISDIRIKDYSSLKSLAIDTSLIPLSTEETLSPIKEFSATTDASGNVSFIFDLDMISALKQTSFGSIFTRDIAPSVKSQILLNANILSMEVIRSRVGVKEDPVVVATSSQRGNRSLLKPHKQKIRDRENMVDASTVGTVFEMNMQGASDIRTFSGTDHSLPSEGKYSYAVKISMSDAIAIYLTTKLIELKAASKDATDWSEEVSGQNYSNSSRSSFSYAGSRAIRKKYKNKNTPIENALSVYSEIAGDVFAATTSTNIIDMAYPMINSVTGSPKGTNFVATMIQSLENNMTNLLGDQISTSQSSTKAGRQPSGASPKATPPEFEKTFDAAGQVIDASQSRTGYVFISSPPSNSGVSVMSKRDYESRLADEVSAYSDGETVSKPPELVDNANLSDAKISSLVDISKTLPTYLTPSSVITPDAVFDLASTNKWDKEISQSAVESLRRYKSGNLTAEGFSLQLLGALGITCEIFGRKRKKRSSGGTFAVDSDDQGAIFSKTDDFTSKNIEESSVKCVDKSETESTNYIADALSPILTTASAPSVTGLDMSLFDNTSDEGILKNLNLKTIRSLPLQIKCLFLSNSPDTKQNWLELNIESLDISFNSIGRVEALSYDKDSNGNAISEWKPLTKLKLDQTTDNSIRCRIKNYSNFDLGIGQSDDLAAPIMNGQFVIGGKNISKPRDISTNSTPQKMRDKMAGQNEIVRNKLVNLGASSGEAKKKKTSASTTPSSITRARTTATAPRIPAGMHQMPDGSLMADSEMPQASVVSGPSSTVSGMGGY